MNRKRFLISAAGATLAPAVVPGLAMAESTHGDAPDRVITDSAQGLALSILPSEFVPGADSKAPAQRVIRFHSRPRHFNVVLRNISRRPLRLWGEENSWGFYNLRLEITGLDDKVQKPISVRRGPVGWGGNGPRYVVLPPGEMLVREIELALTAEDGKVTSTARSYYNFPFPADLMERKIQLVVYYTVEPSDEAKTNGVWTGMIATPRTDILFKQEPS